MNQCNKLKENFMFLYDNQKCPVCGDPFKEGDDIVTCPECGTPHHRACYEKTGRCANYSLHAQGFDYRKTQSEKQQAQQNAARQVGEYYVPPNKDAQGGAAERQTQSEYTHIPMGPAAEPGRKSSFVFKKDEKIGGVLLSDIITVVGSNFMKFITKFRKNKKISWNWSAFIFGPYYLFFRKLYGPGTLFLAIEFAVRVALNLIFSGQLADFSSGLASIINNMPDTYGEYFSQISSLMLSSGVMKAYLILFAVIFALHMIIAMFTDRIYKNKVYSIIQDVDNRLESDSVAPVMPLMFQGNENKSKVEIRKLFLAGKGGVSFTAPCLAYLILSVISNLITYL